MKLVNQILVFVFTLVLLMMLSCISVRAQNFGFESGNLSNWTTAGNDVTISTGVNNVTYGDGLAWTIRPYGTYMAQLYPGGSIQFNTATASLGLTSAENTAIRNFMTANAGGGSPTPTNATWIKRTVTLEAGVNYSFAWNYLSTDYMPYNDGSMMSLVHSTNASVIPTLNNSQQRYALLGFTNTGTGNYSTGSYGSTGWQRATFTVPVTGDYVLGFAAFNLGDTVLSPILFIDEIQGETLKNGQPFAPIEPNAGSSAPSSGGGSTLCCGGSAAAFNANTAFTNRNSTFTATGDNRIIIEQIGNTNTVNVTQVGARNYLEYRATGSNNTLTTNQNTAAGSNTSSTSNYIETIIVGSSNNTSVTQTSTGGNKGVLATVSNNSNSITVTQQNAGSHYAEITLLDSNKSVNLTQSGNANHMARIELSGGATSITTTQSGNTQLHYSLTHNCTTASCSAITVTQGQ